MMIWLAIATVVLLGSAISLAWVLWAIARELDPSMSEGWRAMRVRDEGRNGAEL